MKKKLSIIGVSVLVLTIGICLFANHSKKEILSDLVLENIEALSSGESDLPCPKGCSSLGFGFSSIINCYCEYKSYSSCNKWGC